MYGSPGNETARLMFGVSGHVMKTVSAAKRMNAAACFFDVTNAMIADPKCASGALRCARGSMLLKSGINVGAVRVERPDRQMPHRMLRLKLDTQHGHAPLAGSNQHLGEIQRADARDLQRLITVCNHIRR